MNRLIKRPLKAIWLWTYPLRRPFTAKLEALIARSAPSIPRCRVSEETGLLMDLMVRELVRLQKQLDQIQQTVEDLAPSKTGFVVIAGDNETRSAAG